MCGESSMKFKVSRKWYYTLRTDKDGVVFWEIYKKTGFLRAVRVAEGARARDEIGANKEKWVVNLHIELIEATNRRIDKEAARLEDINLIKRTVNNRNLFNMSLLGKP